MDYFELYGIAPVLQPDPQQVQKIYYLLCRKYHPDQFSLSDTKAQDEAIQMTSLVNEARSVLLHPDRCLEYLLRRQGILNEEIKQELPPDFLMQMMDFNEELMDAKLEGEAETLNRLRLELMHMRTTMTDEVKPLLESSELPIDENAWKQLKEYYLKKKYLTRIEEQMLPSH